MDRYIDPYINIAVLPVPGVECVVGGGHVVVGDGQVVALLKTLEKQNVQLFGNFQ